MTPWNHHAARSRWFGGPPLADVTPRERALLDELAGAVAWAEGLVQVGWLGTGFHDTAHHSGYCVPVLKCRPVYAPREAR